MKMTESEYLEFAKKHGADLTVTKIDRYWQGDGGAIFQKDQLTAYTNDMIEQATQEIAKVMHYPDCWDTAAYPSLKDAIHEWYQCSECANPNSAEIQRLKIEIEVLESAYGTCVPYSVEFSHMINERRARLAELTKGKMNIAEAFGALQIAEENLRRELL